MVAGGLGVVLGLDDDGVLPERALRQCLDDAADGVVVVGDHGRRRRAAEICSKCVVVGKRHVHEVRHDVLCATAGIEDVGPVLQVELTGERALLAVARRDAAGPFVVRERPASGLAGDELVGAAGVEVLDVAVLPVRRLVLAGRALAVDGHRERRRVVARRLGAGPLEGLEDVAALGILQLVVAVIDGLLDARAQRVATAVGAADALVVVGVPRLLVVVGGDGARRPRVSRHGHLGVGEEAVTEAVAVGQRVVVGREGLGVEAVGRVGVVAFVLAGDVDVAEVLVERLVLGDDVEHVLDRGRLALRRAQHLGDAHAAGVTRVDRRVVELVVLGHLLRPRLHLVLRHREVDAADRAAVLQGAGERAGLGPVHADREVDAGPEPGALGVHDPQPVGALLGVGDLGDQLARVVPGWDVQGLARCRGAGAAVPQLDGVDAGKGDEQRSSVGRKGEGVGVGADGSGNGLHRLGAHDPRRAAAASRPFKPGRLDSRHTAAQWTKPAATRRTNVGAANLCVED